MAGPFALEIIRFSSVPYKVQTMSLVSMPCVCEDCDSFYCWQHDSPVFVVPTRSDL